jgi:hypothetical protein
MEALPRSRSSHATGKRQRLPTTMANMLLCQQLIDTNLVATIPRTSTSAQTSSGLHRTDELSLVHCAISSCSVTKGLNACHHLKGQHKLHPMYRTHGNSATQKLMVQGLGVVTGCCKCCKHAGPALASYLP